MADGSVGCWQLGSCESWVRWFRNLQSAIRHLELGKLMKLSENIVKTKDEIRVLLEEKALLIRRDIIKMIAAAGSGHPGGSLSSADILAVLYFHVMRVNPADPHWPDRDRFVLSKGHAAPVLYAALGEAGFFDRSSMWTLRKLGSAFQGHPDMLKVPGVEISTGSLGQGLAAANGMAMAAKIDGRQNRVFALIGDGESQEGEIWEAALFAAHHQLDNLTAVIDFNDLQIDGRVSEIKNVCPIDEKWSAFGWHVICVDGHDVIQLAGAFAKAREVVGKPVIIEATTVKGKGVSFMEDAVDWHGRAPSVDEAAAALLELGVENWD